MKNFGKIFIQGGSQAVRIPLGFRFPDSVHEVEFSEDPHAPGSITLRPVAPLTKDEAISKAERRLLRALGSIEKWSGLDDLERRRRAETVLKRIREVVGE